MIGHGLGAAGGLEAIACIKAINTGWLHPTINQDVKMAKTLNPFATLIGSLCIQSCFNLFLLCMQNLEPLVDIDTVPNVKKQHEVNVGMSQI